MKRNPKLPRIGLALGGGGIRAFAHLGVLRALEDYGVPIHLVAGTSMGGLVAGLYAAGVSLDELITFASQAGLTDLASPDLSWRGFLGHKKMAHHLAELLGRDDITFEELKTPAAVVAADLESSEMVILDRGPLIPALLATSAFPIVFSPVHHQGRWLIDGGVLNNLPVDVVRRMGADRVLAVNTPPSLRLSLEEQGQERRPSGRGRRISGKHLRDWRMPFLIAETSTAMMTQTINAMRLSQFPPDLLLEVSVTNVGLFASERSSEIIEAGYQVAQQQRAALQKLRTRPLPPSWWQRLLGHWRGLRRGWAAFREPDELLVPGFWTPNWDSKDAIGRSDRRRPPA